MDAATVELVKAASRAMCSNDVEAFLRLHDPDAEVLPLTVGVEGHSYRGHDQIRRFFREIHEAFEDWCPEVEDVTSVGAAYVAALRFTGRGRDSGIEIDRHVWQVMRVRDGRAIWWRICTTEQEALEAAEGPPA